MSHSRSNLVLGVDTHKDFHHAALITQLGKRVDDQRFDATPDGYEELISWATDAGFVVVAGIEGTGSYGAGLTLRLQRRGIDVIDVIAPDKQSRRLRGKTDQLDAYSAARAVLAGLADTVPKVRTGFVEALRTLRTTRQMAVKQRTETINQLQGLLVSAPEELRHSVSALTGKNLARACSKLRDRASDDVLMASTRHVVRSLGKRYLELLTETELLLHRIHIIVKENAPEMLDVFGVGPDVASAMLIAVGENMGRIGHEAAFAHLIGTAPLPASSGKTNRHRLNRGGNRQGNSAAYTIVIVRMRHQEKIQEYVAKALARGKSKKETMRLLKRYVAREIYKILVTIHERQQLAQAAPMAA